MLLNHRSDCSGYHYLLFVFCSILLLRWFPGAVFSAVVTLDSIEIFTKHEFLPGKPTVYFHCKGENKIDLPDVKNINFSYTFKGEESWQPLTNFTEKKCKRCGFYERGIIISDEFDEWELCPSDFIDGRYSHFKKKELNATLLCRECEPLLRSESKNASNSHNDSKSHKKGNKLHLALVITISIVGSVIFILVIVGAYKYWRKRKREQDHARFLKLFEDGDEIEDELGLGPLDGVM